MPFAAAICGAILTGLMYWLIWGRGLEYIEYRWTSAATARRDAKARSVSQERQRMAALRSINDPRDAATALMVGVAQQRGEITPEQATAIEREMRDVLSLSDDVTCRLSFAKFAMEQAGHFEEAVAELASLLRRTLTPTEQQELFGMLSRVASVHAGPVPRQTTAIDAVTTAMMAASS